MQKFVSFKYFNLIFSPQFRSLDSKILTSFVAHSWKPCIYDAASIALTLFISTASSLWWCLLFVRRYFISPCSTSSICLVKSFVIKFIWLFFKFDINKNQEICNKSKIMADRERKWMYLRQRMERRSEIGTWNTNNDTSCGDGVIPYAVIAGKNASVSVDIAQKTIARHINNSSEFSAFSAPQHPSAWCIFHSSQFSLLFLAFFSWMCASRHFAEHLKFSAQK